LLVDGNSEILLEKCGQVSLAWERHMLLSWAVVLFPEESIAVHGSWFSPLWYTSFLFCDLFG
jgi:hypothetical protein